MPICLLSTSLVFSTARPQQCEPQPAVFTITEGLTVVKPCVVQWQNDSPSSSSVSSSLGNYHLEPARLCRVKVAALLVVVVARWNCPGPATIAAADFQHVGVPLGNPHAPTIVQQAVSARSLAWLSLVLSI